MNNKSCNCCYKDKPQIGTKREGYGYNNLNGEARDWAEKNGFPKSEFCVPVKGGKEFKGPHWVKSKCGDGRMGFTTRRRGQSQVRMERGPDGQWRRKRNTSVRKRSSKATARHRVRRVDGSRFSLVSLARISEAQRDPVSTLQIRKVAEKSSRSKNRNHRARRLHTKSMAKAA